MKSEKTAGALPRALLSLWVSCCYMWLESGREAAWLCAKSGPISQHALRGGVLGSGHTLRSRQHRGRGPSALE